MSSSTRSWIAAAAVVAMLPQFAGAAPVTTSMNFDLLVDGDQVGEAYAGNGYHWKNAMVFDAIDAGSTFPPSPNNIATKHSDANCGADCDVMFDSDFAISELLVAGLVTGSGKLQAVTSAGTFDIDLLGDGSGCPAGTDPLWTCIGSGKIQFTLDQNVRRITFTAAGGQGAIDSLTVTQFERGTNVPEPGSLALAALGLIGAVASRRKSKA